MRSLQFGAEALRTSQNSPRQRDADARTDREVKAKAGNSDSRGKEAAQRGARGHRSDAPSGRGQGQANDDYENRDDAEEQQPASGQCLAQVGDHLAHLEDQDEDANGVDGGDKCGSIGANHGPERTGAGVMSHHHETSALAEYEHAGMTALEWAAATAVDSAARPWDARNEAGYEHLDHPHEEDDDR